MNRALGAFLTCGLFIWLFLSPGVVFSTPPMFPRKFTVEPKMEPNPSGPGPFTLKLVIGLDSLFQKDPNCSEVSIVLQDKHNLNYTGPDSLTRRRGLI